MPTVQVTRGQLLKAVVALWLVAMLTALVLRPKEEVVVVTHWANGHMMNPNLLPAFAKSFNAAGHRTQSGSRIEVRPLLVNSGVIQDQLLQRLDPNAPMARDCKAVGCGVGRELADPIIVTPAADHWLSLVNYASGRTIIDLPNTKAMATTYIGIVTLREMAQCLGWPNKEVGIAEVLALRADPRGWASCPTARAEWGQQPLISFTDPDSSSTGRSMLYTLYSIAAGKPTEALTPSDVADSEVTQYVKTFQRGVDHYDPDSLTLNSKVYLGPRYGHFFFISETNLVQLYQGKLAVTVVAETKPRPLEREMVMIYPKEGSPGHNHSAAVVRAPWVTSEQSEAAERWIAYVLEDTQQRAFVEDGFRPTTNVPYTDVISRRNGLDPNQPTRVLRPDRIAGATADAIVNSWGEVKNPGVVTFVVDTSGSMSGKKLEQAKAGVLRALDNVHVGNQVGLLTFSNGINHRVPVAPITENRFAIRTAVEQMRASGGTALYDAIAEGIRITDEAPAAPDAIRGVVVLTDGKANAGGPLHGLVQMTSTRERPLVGCTGFEGETSCREDIGLWVRRPEIIGAELALETRNRVHIFPVGIGDADPEISRILAEATRASYKPATEKNLVSVLEQFGKYF